MATPDQVKFSTNPLEGTSAESELVIFRSELPSYNPSSNKFVRINLPVPIRRGLIGGTPH